MNMNMTKVKQRIGVLLLAASISTAGIGTAVITSHGVDFISTPAAYADECDGSAPHPPPGFDCQDPAPTATPTATATPIDE